MFDKKRFGSELNRRFSSIFILGLFIILGAMFVSAATVTIVSPDTGSYYGTGQNVTINATFTQQTNVTAYAVNVTDTTGVQTYFEEVTGQENLSGFTSLIVWNASDETVDGTYTINISVNDSGTSYENTITTIVDHTNPLSTILITGSKNRVRNQDLTSVAIVDYGADLVVDCGVSDATAGLSTTRSAILIKYPGVSSFANISSDLITSENGTLKASLRNTETSFLGDFEIQCSFYDQADNSNNTYYNFSTQSVVVDKGSPFTNENFVSPIGKTLIGRGTVENYAVKYGALPEDGDARLIKKQGGIILLIGEEEHTVMVDDIDDASATLTISSEPFTFDINVDETKEVDVDGDGTNDLEIYLHKIHQRAADLVFKEIATPVVAEEETIEEAVEDVVVMPVEEEKDLGWLWTLFILVIVIVIFMFILHKFTGGPKGAATGIKFKPRDLGSSKNGSWGTPEVSSKKGSKPFY